ncbi:MAG: bifunctional glycosyltransferase/class I SAM-dependent methyltransferase [Syntrophobacter sp.]
MEMTRNVEACALKVLEKNKVAVFVVAYNAEKHIESVLKRIPPWVAERLSEIYVVDDSSVDKTVEAVNATDWPDSFAPLNIYRTPYNQGYGGNQRLGYKYAIEKGIDIVVLLHGDGQYAPEFLPQMLAPYEDGADAVFGSRFLKRFEALRGKMPIYKWVGNRILTAFQNFLLGSKLSELHSGYRSYRTSALKKIPFECNSLWFDFDADIIIQLNAAKLKIAEVAIPTFYGDEICHVNGILYAARCIKSAIKYRLMQYEIFYDPKYAIYPDDDTQGTVKFAKTSLHHYVRNLSIESGSKLLDLGGGHGDAIAKAHSRKGVDITCIDRIADPANEDIRKYRVDLDEDWGRQFPMDKYDTVFALDIIEHLRSPENAAQQLFECMRPGGRLFASTGNIAYLPLRCMFLLGFFNWGRRGILDLTHTRLFTLGSFRRLFRNAGFRVEKVLAFGPPLRDLADRSNRRKPILAILDFLSFKAARFWPGLLAYQILLLCIRTDDVRDLMKSTFSRPGGNHLP